MPKKWRNYSKRCFIGMALAHNTFSIHLNAILRHRK